MLTLKRVSMAQRQAPLIYTNCILGLVAWGDASAEAAAKDGGITIIEHVDYEYMNILFIYQRFTTIAHGK